MINNNTNKKLRVCLLMKGGKDWIGGAEYVNNIVLALNRLPTQKRNEFELYLIYNKSNELFVKEAAKDCEKVFCYQTLFSSNILGKLINSICARIHYPYEFGFSKFIKDHKIDIVYPSFVPPYNKLLEKKVIGWIPDFQHIHYPNYFKKNELLVRDNAYKRMANKAKTIVLSSKDAQRDFEKLYTDKVKNTAVINFTTITENQWFTTDPFSVQKKYNLPDKFFIVSNQFWQHKNHGIVFEALHRLKDNTVKPIIVCTGSFSDNRNMDYISSLNSQLKEWNLTDQIVFLGLIPKDDQMALLRRSIAVIQPSLFEGWSTVVENAKAVGKSILISNIPVHKEQNPQNAIYFNPADPIVLANIITTSWTELKPGPDENMEQQAKELNQKAVTLFAENLLNVFKNHHAKAS